MAEGKTTLNKSTEGKTAGAVLFNTQQTGMFTLSDFLFFIVRTKNESLIRFLQQLATDMKETGKLC